MRIEGESLPPNHVVSKFLRQITDPEYKSTIDNLRYQNADLDTCIDQIRKKERTLIQERQLK